MSRVNNRTKKNIYRRSRVVISRRKKKQKNEKKILKGGGDGEKEVFFYEGWVITPEEHLELDGWTRKNDNDNDNSWYVKGTNINDNNKYMLVSSKPKYEETINNKLEEYKNNPDKRLLEAAVAVARAEARLKFLNMIKKRTGHNPTAEQLKKGILKAADDLAPVLADWYKQKLSKK